MSGTFENLTFSLLPDGCSLELLYFLEEKGHLLPEIAN
jgi:hypothetical protein